MKKTTKKKAATPLKKNTVATKKNHEPVSAKKKAEDQKKLVYPDWTTPEHLDESDHKNLKRFYEIFSQQNLEVALNFASELDTIVRDEIPLDIWKQCGGKLTRQGEEGHQGEEGKGKTADNAPVAIENAQNEDVSANEEKTQQEAKKRQISGNTDAGKQIYLLKNDKPQELTGNSIIDGNEINEVRFHSKKELEVFILVNYLALFGGNMVIIDNTKSEDEYFPNILLFEFNELDKPRMYIIEAHTADTDLGLLYARVTHFIASLKNKSFQGAFLDKLEKMITCDSKMKKAFQAFLTEEQSISEMLSEMIGSKPMILLVRNDENVVLNLMQDVYSETWGKMVLQVMIKKFYKGDDKFLSVEYANHGNAKKVKEKVEVVKSTIEDHLNSVSDTIRQVFSKIKESLIKADPSIEFNPKKHYISLRKNKNLAFFHLRKKITLVVMNPEDDTRKQIKHHEIKSLPASVQKFWNGPSCTIIIEDSSQQEEVILLLKKMIAKA